MLENTIRLFKGSLLARCVNAQTGSMVVKARSWHDITPLSVSVTRPFLPLSLSENSRKVDGHSLFLSRSLVHAVRYLQISCTQAVCN